MFCSNVHRVAQIIEAATKFGRKVIVFGRSMENIVDIGRKMGTIKAKNSDFLSPEELAYTPDDKVCIICTGSQGEPMAALSRIVSGDNRNTTIYPGDTVIFSSNPIPGNGVLVDRLVNNLVKMGADVKQNSLAFSLHSSGHPSRQELRLMQRLVKPKYFMPVHGEYRMLKLHGDIAMQLGMKQENVFICDNGDNIVLKDHKITRGIHISAEDVYIDGNDLDGVSGAIMSDRDILKNDGMISIILTIESRTNTLIVPPIVYARGFSSAETNHVVRHSQIRAEEAVRELMKERVSFGEIKTALKSVVSKYVERKTGRKPMIIPLIMNKD